MAVADIELTLGAGVSSLRAVVRLAGPQCS